jgi:hypothetical protein
MKLIYTNENRFLVTNAKNLLENAGIEVVLRNEFAAGGAGDLSPFDTWLELWVEDLDYEKSLQVIKYSSGSDDDVEWVCDNCHETNDAAFDFCWSCQHEKL